MSETKIQILGIGNPLLDISVDVDPSFLEKYGLDANTQYMADEKTLPLFAELEKMPEKKMIPGGSSQNAIRAAQWVLKTPGVTAFAGCVGKDEFGRSQEEILKNEGVLCGYEVIDTAPTGTCAALITGKNRCLIANIGAANCFHTSHMLKGFLATAIESAKIIYSESFFVSVSMESLLIAAHHCLNREDKTFSLNLSAKWVIDGFLTSLLELLPYADIIFCNEDEARCFARNMKWKETVDTSSIAKEISLLPKLNPKKDRVVVITQGADPVICAYTQFCDKKDNDKVAIMGGTTYCGSNSSSSSSSSSTFPQTTVTSTPVLPIPSSSLKDTNGCGDSFVGAFLSYYLNINTLHSNSNSSSSNNNNNSLYTLNDCINAGNRMAQLVARQSGCVFPKEGKI